MKHYLFLFGLLSIFLTSCERVAPNFQGVLMENFGQNGKSDFTLVKGRVSTIAPGTELFQVPLWEQRGTFETTLHVQDADRTEYTCEPNYSFTPVADRAIDLVFNNKHLGSGDDFVKSLQDNVLEPAIYDIIKDISRNIRTEVMTSTGGNLKFENLVRDSVESRFAQKGLKLETFTVQLVPSEKVRKMIDKRSEVNTGTDVIEQEILKQKKQNELAELKAKENEIISRGLSKEILIKEFIDKWDGKTPLYGGTPFDYVKEIK